MEFFQESFFHLLVWLAIGHYIADYPLQIDFIAMAKNENTEAGKIYWKHVLTAHSAVHAGFVFLFTGSLFLCLAEFVAHFVIDRKKNNNEITLEQDQQYHLYCKLAWAIIFFIFMRG